MKFILLIFDFVLEYACCLKCLDCGDDKECSSPHISLLPIIDCQPTRHEKPVCFQFYYAKGKVVSIL